MLFMVESDSCPSTAASPTIDGRNWVNCLTLLLPLLLLFSLPLLLLIFLLLPVVEHPLTGIGQQEKGAATAAGQQQENDEQQEEPV
jgi:hypothetical protein